jgi:HEAT repeat protein
MNLTRRSLAYAPAVLAGCSDLTEVPNAELLTMLRSDDADERDRSVAELARRGGSVAPEVARLLGDDDLVAAMAASEVLARTGKPAVPALLDALKTGNRRARGWAAHALGRIGPDAREAVPALTDMSKDHDFKQTALEAIGRIQP